MGNLEHFPQLIKPTNEISIKPRCCLIDYDSNENQTTEWSCPVPYSMVFGVRNIKDIFLCIISKTLENQEQQKVYGVC